MSMHDQAIPGQDDPESWLRWSFRWVYETVQIRTIGGIISSAVVMALAIAIRIYWQLPPIPPAELALLARAIPSAVIAIEGTALLAGLAWYAMRIWRRLSGRAT